MNVCCSGKTNEEFSFAKSPFDQIFLNLDKTQLKFVKEGYFTAYDSENDKIKENKDIIELEKQIDSKQQEILKYENKIHNIKRKLNNMEKILLIDQKEQQYINIIGENNDL